MLSRLVSSSIIILFFKQKTAYEMRISDWSSDVCSSDLYRPLSGRPEQAICPVRPAQFAFPRSGRREPRYRHDAEGRRHRRSEEHTSELQSLMRSSYAVFCLKTKKPTSYQTGSHAADPIHARITTATHSQLQHQLNTTYS